MLNPAIVEAEVTERRHRLLAEAAARRRVRVSRVRTPRRRMWPWFGRVLSGRAGHAEVGGCAYC